jgi:signal transduction histidine kinase
VDDVRDIPRPLPWVASIVYLAVLATGVFYDLAGLAAPKSRAGFVAVIGLLLALELVEWRFLGSRPSRKAAVPLLLVRMLLFAVVTALDPDGFSRVLYLLIPFVAYFWLGRWISYALAAGYLTVAVVRVSSAPGWTADAEQVSDLLMFLIGMLFAVSMAAVAAEAQASQARAQASQARAEKLFEDLGRSHRQLLAYTEQAAELATVTERNRLARDIHDSLGHHLTAIAIQLQKADAFRDRDPATADQAVADARSSVKQALRDVRQSVETLRDEPFSLTSAMTALAEGLQSADPPITVEIHGEANGHSPAALMTLYRAAQEGVTNAYRHGRAQAVGLTLSLGETEAVLEVVDDGRGFDLEQSARSGGHGLRGMSERVALAGGVLRVDTAPGHGTRLTVRVPAS